jgi:hypothetical protein
MAKNYLLKLLEREPALRRVLPRSYVNKLSPHERLRIGLFPRNHYAYLVKNAAELARALGLERVSVIEFGVAGGNGLIEMERCAEAFGRSIGIEIEVYGFDAGSGMPAPIDYRDCPHVWQTGFYEMDEAALRSRLKTARLYIGDVGETVKKLATDRPAPVGGISFDLDYYSSTVKAFEIFDLPSEFRLPRVHLYFDDILGSSLDAMCEGTGELLAIEEFNQAGRKRGIYPDRSIIRSHQKRWLHFKEQIYVMHDFEHPSYCRFVGRVNDQRPLPQQSEGGLKNANRVPSH